VFIWSACQLKGIGSIPGPETRAFCPCSVSVTVPVVLLLLPAHSMGRMIRAVKLPDARPDKREAVVPAVGTGVRCEARREGASNYLAVGAQLSEACSGCGR
jgi:hypothetical protein